MAQSHKHKTAKKLTLAQAAAVAVNATPATRQAQIDNLTPSEQGDWIIFLAGSGCYARVANAQDTDGDKFEPAYTLEEASRWAQESTAPVIQALKTEMANSDGLAAGDIDDLGITAMTYADALAQERDANDPAADNGDQISQADFLAFLTTLGMSDADGQGADLELADLDD